MLEAAQHVANVSHVEQDPLLIILWRLNHQDRTLDAIKGDLHAVGATLNDPSPARTSSRNPSTKWSACGKARSWSARS